MGRPHDPALVVEVLVDLGVAVGVVAERDRVGAGLEQVPGGALPNSECRGVRAQQ